MKILTLHCDYIRFKALKKALKSVEDLTDKEKEEHEIKEPLVVMTAVEEGDDDQVFKEYLEAIKKTAGEVKAKNIVLYPYAHLSSNLSKPDHAKSVLVEAEKILKKEGFAVARAPFGYYKEFELKVKGHPLSELSKQFGNKENILTKSDVSKLAKEKAKDDGKVENLSVLLKSLSRSKLDTSKLKENDHRILGQKLDLFSFNEAAPGSVFWHKNGKTIYNEMVKFSRELHEKFGYDEIETPQILDNKMWRVSGHWSHYNMFKTNYEDHDLGVKPMNCPGMMLVYKSNTRSYKDLPMRLFEFGKVHRVELSGVLAGMFRLIQFTQDDSHIFCTQDQIGSEIDKVVQLLNVIYKDTFGMNYRLELSTRPEKFLGEKKDWDEAEKALEDVLKKSKIPYKVNEGDGAFYGPKIDIHVTDSLGRNWQCATIQLDMQIPKRFECEYVDKDGKPKTPIVIHRALFGSIERFIGILLEQTNGALPLWLSPVQIRLINFTDKHAKATEKIAHDLMKELPGVRIDLDLESSTVSDKVRQAEVLRIPYIIVIGDKEVESKTLAVRSRGEKPKFGVKIDHFVKEVKDKIEKRI